jgi:hypothetical protein
MPNELELEAIEQVTEVPVEINNKYLPLLDNVERLRVYMSEEIDEWDTIRININNVLAEEEEKLEYINLINNSLNQFSNVTEALYNETFSLINNKSNIDQYLTCLLSIRFGYLTTRKNSIRDYLSAPRDKEISHIIPTSKRLFKWVAQDEKLARHKKHNNRLRIHAIQKFELLNLLIRDAYNSCTPDELTSPTKDLLRKSVQLHSLLDGSSQNLGHPDAAGGDYALLEALIFDINECELDKNSYKKDFSSPLLKLDLVTKDRMIWLCKEGMYEISLSMLHNYIKAISLNDPLDNSKGVRDELKLERKLLSIKRKLDTEVYEAHSILKERINPDSNMKKAFKNRLSVANLTDYDAGIWPYELPYPAFLKSRATLQNSYKQQNNYISTIVFTKQKGKKRHNRSKKNGSNKPNVRNPEEPAFPSSPLTNRRHSNKLQEAEAPISITKSNSTTINLFQEQSQLATPLSHFDIIVADQELPESKKGQHIATRKTQEEVKSKKGKEKIEEISTGLELKEQISIEEIAVPEYTLISDEIIPARRADKVWSFKDDWILPRGLRSFHPKMLEYPYLIHGASNKHLQNIVDQLFDSKQQCKVSFRDFETLWESEKGRIIGNYGGSHKELIAPRGESLFGIFSHKKSQTYGKKYIKYLQTAILYIGLKPNYELQKDTI